MNKMFVWYVIHVLTRNIPSITIKNINGKIIIECIFTSCRFHNI